MRRKADAEAVGGPRPRGLRLQVEAAADTLHRLYPAEAAGPLSGLGMGQGRTGRVYGAYVVYELVGLCDAESWGEAVGGGGGWPYRVGILRVAMQPRAGPCVSVTWSCAAVYRVHHGVYRCIYMVYIYTDIHRVYRTAVYRVHHGVYRCIYMVYIYTDIHRVYRAAVYDGRCRTGASSWCAARRIASRWRRSSRSSTSRSVRVKWEESVVVEEERRA
jgi:hypothetical protein